MPVQRGPSQDLNDSGDSSNNAEHAHNDVAAMHHAGGMGQFQGYGHQSTESQQWPPSEYPPAYSGYNQAMFGHLPSFDNANIQGNFGGQKTYYRSESMPVDHQNGGNFTGRHSFSPSSFNNWTDTSSDDASSYGSYSLSGIGSVSMNSRNQIIGEPNYGIYTGGTTPILHQPYDESHYDGTNGGSLHSMHHNHIGDGTPSIHPMPDQYGNIAHSHDEYGDDSWWKSLM